jgi:hypothetical protein
MSEIYMNPTEEQRLFPGSERDDVETRTSERGTSRKCIKMALVMGIAFGTS